MDAMDQVPGFLFIDHVGVSVNPGELESQIALYKAMGCREIRREDLFGPDLVREVLLQIGEGPNRIQLLEPLGPESPVARQLERNGGRGGLAHIAVRVSEIHAAFNHFKQKGFHIIDQAPRRGSHGTAVFFVHPKTTPNAALGYLLEIVQEGAYV